MSSYIVETNSSPITEDIDIKKEQIPLEKKKFNLSNKNIFIAISIVIVVIIIVVYYSKHLSVKEKEDYRNKEEKIMEIEVQKLRDFQESLVNTI